MDVIYLLCAFIPDNSINFYQKIIDGVCVDLVDLEGNSMILTEPFSYEIIDPEIKLNLFPI
jgi:hypothetical protein